MSTERQTLFFEGFLKKRKDTMKMKWATYWFRLQNTTLFFYTKKHGSALNLRGLYYIYTVQSVREVQREKCKRYVFEITMNNGKRKVLAAETSDLRTEWISQLWRAMHLSAPGGSDPGCIQQDVCEIRVRGHSSLYNSSDSESVTDTLETHPISAPPTSNLDQGDSTTLSLSLTDELSSDEAIYQNTTVRYKEDNIYSVHRFSGRSEEERDEREEEGDYDILPSRNSQYLISQSEEDFTQKEGLYDVPLSSRRANNHEGYREMTDSIYDIPNSILRRMSEHTLEPSPGDERPAEGEGVLGDMKVSLGGKSVGWMTGASGPEDTCTC